MSTPAERDEIFKDADGFPIDLSADISAGIWAEGTAEKPSRRLTVEEVLELKREARIMTDEQINDKLAELDKQLIHPGPMIDWNYRSEGELPKLNILHEADRVTSGRAHEDYGSVNTDFNRIAALCQPILDAEPKGIMTAQKVALFMVQVKISRQCNKHKLDNLIDGCGYLRTVEMLHDGL